jgi:diamine N-acetyltransferase
VGDELMAAAGSGARGGYACVDVALRPYTEGDAGLLRALLGDPEMTRFLGGPESDEALAARHARYLSADPETNGVFTIVVGDTPEGAGWVGFWESEWEGRSGWECGWHVLPRYQGAGVASAAALQMLEHAIQRRRYRWMHAFPAIENLASNALCVRLGFEDLGETDMEYPKGRMMKSRHWRFDLERRRIVVGTATLDEAPLLAELGERTFRDTFAADNTEADMAAYLSGAFGVEIQRRELADPASSFLVATVDGVPAGYAQLRTGNAPAGVSGENVIEIGRFYSDKPWIGAGVGPALMQACIDAAVSLGHDVIWLDVWERNPRAIAFYQKWGFSVVGEKDFVLGEDVQHDLILARPAR